MTTASVFDTKSAAFKIYYRANRRRILGQRQDPTVRARYKEYRKKFWLKNRLKFVQYSRKWYTANKQRALIYAAQYKRRIYKETGKIARAAKSKPCKDCRRRFPHYIMDFDHTRGNKCGELGKFRTNIAAFLRELAKCDIVCANCHRRRTHVRKLRQQAGK